MQERYGHSATPYSVCNFQKQFTYNDYWETIKIKTPEGESKQAILGDGADAEEYVKHLMSFDWFMEKKWYGADLENAAKTVLKAGLTLKKHRKVPKGEKDPAKADRLTKVEAAKKELTATKVVESTIVCLGYNIIHKLSKDDPEIQWQWDWIVAEMHTKNPWEDTKGAKHHGLCDQLQQSLIDFIKQLKLTFFAVNAADRLKYYIWCVV